MKTRANSILAILFSTILLANPVLTWSSVDSSDWVFIGFPLGDTSLKDMAVDPENENLWYIGSHENGLYLTRDAGNTWEQHIGGNIGAIALDPNNHNIVYVSSGSDLYKSDDQGATWGLVFSFPNPIPGPTLDAPTFIDSILVSVTDGTIVVGLTAMFHSARVYTSSDGGVTWDTSFEAESGFHFWDMAEVPINGYWFFCTEDPSHIANPIVVRSTDRGQSWEEMVPLTGIPTAGHGLNLEVHPVTQAVYFLTESSFLSSSTDFGDTWSPFQSVDFGSVLLIDRNRPNRFFGGEFVRGVKVGGVYLSEDTGESFSFIGLADRTIASLALNGTSTKLFAVAYGYGIYVIGLGDGITQVAIDIKPGSDANSVNPRSNGVIPMALLGSEDFDIHDVDVTTLTFGPAGATPKHDLTDEWSYSEHVEDVNLDGFMDLVTHYPTRDTGIGCGDTEAALSGELLDGRPFEGTDEIRTVGCRKHSRDVSRREAPPSLHDALRIIEENNRGQP
jgi:photosystem II stability/assembly factor-like uncharacterized protein